LRRFRLVIQVSFQDDLENLLLKQSTLLTRVTVKRFVTLACRSRAFAGCWELNEFGLVSKARAAAYWMKKARANG
jgi:hypothetical protein